MNVKKLLSTLLAAAMVITLAPLNVFAVVPTPAEDLTPASITDNTVTLNKTAVQTALDEWEVTLNVSGGGTQAADPIDIVLVMDASGSMLQSPSGSSQSKDKIAQDAAKNLINDLFSKKVNANIGVVKFNNLATITTNGLVPLLNASGSPIAANKNAIQSAIANANAEYDTGTNMQQGLVKARTLLSSSSHKKYVILLSDGAPTYYNEGHYGWYWVSDFLGYHREYGYISAGGDGQNFTNDVRNSTTTAANNLKQLSNLQLYTIGFAYNDGGYLAQIATSANHYKFASGDNLKAIFDEVINQILRFINEGSVTDVMGSNVSLIGTPVITPNGSLKDTSGKDLPANKQPNVQVSGNTINWYTGAYIENDATLTYRVKLNNINQANEQIALNDHATLIYKKLSSGVAEPPVNFPIPKAVYQTGTLTVSHTGLPTPPAAHQYNAQLVGKGSWESKFNYTDTAISEAGYRLQEIRYTYNGNTTTYATEAAFAAAKLHSNLLTVLNGAQAVEYVYTARTDLSYQFKYYKDSFDDASYLNAVTVTGKTFGNSTSIIDDHNQIPTGYKVEYYTAKDNNSKITGQWPLIAADGSTVIFVKYVKDDSQRYDYTVKYYKDGASTPFETVNATVAKHTPIVSSVPDKMPVGYKLNTVASTGLPYTVSATNREIKIYYVKDDSQRYDYTVKYYKDGALTEFAKENLSVPKHTPIVSSVPDKMPVGYKLDTAASTGLPYTVSATDKEIKIYYVKDDSQRYDYTVKYYKDGASTEFAKENLSVPKHTPIVSSVPDKMPVGYKLNAVVSTRLPYTVSLTNKEIKIYYVKDDSQRYDYTVKYYKDGASTEFAKENLSVPKHTPIVSSVPDKMPAGYKLDTAASTSLPYTVSATDKEIKVYYIKDDSQRYDYTVKYYKDGASTPFAKENLSVPKHTPIVDSVPDKMPVGYKLDTAASTGLPYTVSATSKEIKIFYVKDDSQRFDYTVKYYKDGASTPFETVNATVAKHTPVVNNVSYTNKPAGYKLDTVASTKLPYTVSLTNKEIKVCYVIDPSKWVNVDFEIVGDVTNPLPATQTILKNGKATEPTDLPTKSGYHLDGWYTVNHGGNLSGKYNFNTSVWGPTTLYAKWVGDPATYSVKYYQQSKTDLSSYVEDTDAVQNLPSQVGETATVSGYENKYPGYSFNAGRSTVSTTIAAASGTELSVYYDLISYSVEFNTDGHGTLNGGTGPIVSPAYYQDVFPASPTPAPTGDYEFKGWQRNGTGDLIDPITETVVTESVTYTAIFEAIPKFTVNFAFVDAPAGAPSVPAPITDVLRGSTVSRPADPDFAGYDFDGWYKDQACEQEFNFGNDGDAIIQSITLYGKFNAKSVSYTINHIKEDRNNLGQYLDPVDVDTGSKTVGETITANANSYDGYEVVGENAQEHSVVANDVGSTIVLEFKYDLIPYTVTFRPGEHGTLTGAGEDGNVVNTPVYYNDSLTAPEVTVTTSESAVYTFIGWDSDDDGDADYTSENLPSVAGDATYTAVYTSKEVYGYTIYHWIQGEDKPFLTHRGTATEGDTANVTQEQVAAALEQLGNDYQTVGDPYANPILIPTDDNIIYVYYEKKPDSHITVVHQYYLNNTTLESEVSKNAGIVDPGTEVDAASYQEPGSYTYWKTEITRDELPTSSEPQETLLKSQELELGAEDQEKVAELEAKIKEDRAQVLKDHPDATEEEIDQWIAEYGATMVDDRYQTLKDKLDDLNARISELEPEDKDDGSSSDSERSDSSEASSSEASSSEASSSEASSSEASSSEASSSEASSSEASSSEASSSEASSSEASSSEASSSEASSSEASSSEASSSEASSSEASSSEASSSEDQAKLLAELKKERAEVQDQFDDLVETRDKYEFIKPLYAHTKALSELTGVPMTLATVDYQVAETVIWPPVDGKFTYQDGYAYTITIFYNRVVQYNGGDDDDDDDDDDDNTVTIINPRVPLAQLPKEELVTILDQDVPLGNLPKTGGSAENAAGSLGAMAMVLGILMKIFGKSHKDDQ